MASQPERQASKVKLPKSLSPEDPSIAHIKGNASPQFKYILANHTKFLGNRFPNVIKKPIFAEGVFCRLKATEASLIPKAEESSKLEGRLIVEIVVEEDMLNSGATLHGACAAYMIDQLSTVALLLLQFETTGEFFIGVSQTMNLIYHSPAVLGDKLRVVSTTVATGTRSLSAQTEIWNETRHRLVASATHIKMREREQVEAKL